MSISEIFQTDKSGILAAAQNVYNRLRSDSDFVDLAGDPLHHADSEDLALQELTARIVRETRSKDVIDGVMKLTSAYQDNETVRNLWDFEMAGRKVKDTIIDNAMAAVRSDSLPDIESAFSHVGDQLPARQEPIIEGVLRLTHIMQLTGASKDGKSFCLIEMAVAFSAGAKWLGRQCTKGHVLYVNLEIDPASFYDRVQNVATAMNVNLSDLRNLDVWNLRGQNASLSDFSDALKKRCYAGHYEAVIIDPIYPLFEGDENSAADTRKLFMAFSDIAQNLSCAVIYSHHHSKGAKGSTSAIDRGSGSGMFGRAPDAMIDLLSLEVTEDALTAANESGMELTAFATGSRIEYTLREFPAPAAETCFFDYPIHVMDTNGILKDARSAKDAVSVDNARRNAKSQKKDWKQIIDNLYDHISKQGRPVTLMELADMANVAPGTVKNQLSDCGYKTRKGIVTKITNDGCDFCDSVTVTHDRDTANGAGQDEQIPW